MFAMLHLRESAEDLSEVSDMVFHSLPYKKILQAFLLS